MWDRAYEARGGGWVLFGVRRVPERRVPCIECSSGRAFCRLVLLLFEDLQRRWLLLVSVKSVLAEGGLCKSTHMSVRLVFDGGNLPVPSFRYQPERYLAKRSLSLNARLPFLSNPGVPRHGTPSFPQEQHRHHASAPPAGLTVTAPPRNAPLIPISAAHFPFLIPDKNPATRSRPTPSAALHKAATRVPSHRMCWWPARSRAVPAIRSAAARRR